MLRKSNSNSNMYAHSQEGGGYCGLRYCCLESLDRGLFFWFDQGISSKSSNWEIWALWGFPTVSPFLPKNDRAASVQRFDLEKWARPPGDLNLQRACWGADKQSLLLLLSLLLSLLLWMLIVLSILLSLISILLSILRLICVLLYGSGNREPWFGSLRAESNP